MAEKITIKKGSSDYRYMLTYRGGDNSQVKYSRALYITKFPTENCQLSSIGCFGDLRVLVDEPILIKRIMVAIRKHTCNQIFVDVRFEKWEYIAKIMKPFLKKVYKRQYVSTNGTLMVSGIYAWRDFQ